MLDHHEVSALETVEVEAFVDLHKVASRVLPAETSFDAARFAQGCAISFPSASSIGLNRVVGLRSLSEIELASQWMSGKRGRRHLQIVRDVSILPEVRRWLAERGFVQNPKSWLKLWRPAPTLLTTLQAAPTTRLATAADGSLFGAIMCEGFGFPHAAQALWSSIVGAPGWSCFIAEVDNAPAGVGAMFSAGGYAWLGGGTARLGYRGMGVQKALIDARLNHGAVIGVRRFAVEVEAPWPGQPSHSFDNLTGFGFVKAFTRDNFEYPSAALLPQLAG